MVGLLYTTFGVMTEKYPHMLGIEQSSANLVGAVGLGVFLFTVPFNTILVSNVNLRICSAIGCFFAIGGVLSSAWASQLWHLLVGLSLCGGYGVSMLWTATIKIVPHYFKARQKMAYMATGIGYGIGRAVFPYIVTTIYDATNYRDTVLYTVIFFAFSITAPICYREQLPKDRPKTAAKLLKAYVHPLKRYIAPFHLANGYLWNAELTGVAVVLFTYVDRTTGSETIATNVQTINGAMQMAGAIGLTLILLKVKMNHYVLQIVCNFLIGVACIVLGAYKNEYSFYVTSGILGFMEAIMVGNITCVCHHLYPEKDVVYAFGFHEAVGGIAGFVAPYTAGLLQERYGDEIGFYYLAANSMLGGALYIIAGLIRPTIWTHRPEPEEESNDSTSATSATEGSNEKASLSSSDATADDKLQISADDVKPELTSGAAAS